MALVLTRRRGEVLVIRHRDHEEVIEVRVAWIGEARVRLSMEGDAYEVLREELLTRDRRTPVDLDTLPDDVAEDLSSEHDGG